MFGIYLFVSITGSNVHSKMIIKSSLHGTFILKLPNNDLTEVCYILSLKTILFLDLGYNILKNITSNCLASVHLLYTLYINNNQIIFLEKHSFGNFTNLIFLNISNNPLTNLPKLFCEHFLN